MYSQRDATFHSLFNLETALHVSGGTSTHPQERKQLYLQYLVLVTPLLLSAAIVGTGLSVLCCVVGGVRHLQHNTTHSNQSQLLHDSSR